MKNKVKEFRAKLIRCVDGDTVDFEVDLGFYIHGRIRFRLIGVNTPERGRPQYAEATRMLEDLIEKEADEEGYITIRTGKTGKYGRWLVDIGEGGAVNEALAKIWPY